MKRFAFLMVALLAACSSDPFEREQTQRILHRGRAPAANAQFAALRDSGAAQKIVSIEKRKAATTVVLAATRDGLETWITGDTVSLQFKHGVLMATRGLGGDILAADVTPTSQALRAGRETTLSRRYSFINGDQQEEITVFQCAISNRGMRQIDWNSRSLATQLIEERCVARSTSYTNLYWISDDRIVQSRQWAGDFTGPLALREVPR